MNTSQRSYQKELLDRDDIPFEDIKQNMHELNRINTLLGGHRISIEGLKLLAAKRKEVRICEIGCGGGDNIVALDRWCRKQNIAATFIGIDIKKECVDYAATVVDFPVEWIISDYKLVSFNHRPDVIFSSLFCHHFTNEELIMQLKWMRDNSLVGFFINDLHRNRLACYSINIITRFFSSSYLVKNDAPLSVLRGFKKKEWVQLLEAAQINPFVICWRWAFRYLIIYRHE